MSTHLAAVLIGKGQPFEIKSRPTPKPGPNELLVAVKSVALNPADAIMRSTGLFITGYPTVTGFDMAGVVLEVGQDVPTGDDKSLSFQPGNRVVAYAASAWRSCAPDYGVFQEKCLVPWQHAVPIPDDNISWNHAATLPVSVQVPLSAWDEMGILRTEEAGSESGKVVEKNQVLLVWGASSSVGTMGVQSARIMCQDPNSPFAAVYATAGSSNHEYIRSLGADRVFDYKDPEVVGKMVSAAQENGLSIRHCFLAMGKLSQCQDVLKSFVETGDKTSKIVSAPRLPGDAKDVEGVQVTFVMPSMVEEERLEQFRYWMGTWLRKHLAKGSVIPSPEPTVIGKGLEFVNEGLDKMAEGVSCTKLVIEIGE
jgi:NADPH:quinone reductase-like Zn-dependent oxidoreductase